MLSSFTAHLYRITGEFIYYGHRGKNKGSEGAGKEKGDMCGTVRRAAGEEVVKILKCRWGLVCNVLCAFAGLTSSKGEGEVRKLAP